MAACLIAARLKCDGGKLERGRIVVHNENFSAGAVADDARAPKRCQEGGGGNRFGQIILQRETLRRRLFGHYRDNDDWSILICSGAANRLEHIPTKRIGQDQVEQNRAVGRSLCLGHGFGAAGGTIHHVTGLRENLMEPVQIVLIVFDDENFRSRKDARRETDILGLAGRLLRRSG